MSTQIDPATYRKVLGHHPTGVCAITAIVDGAPIAMVAGSFASVSLDPPLVGFFPDRKSTSWPKIRSAGRFCVNILGAHQQDVCRILAGKGDDKFRSLSYRLSDAGTPVIAGATAWIDCDLHSEAEAGDHFLILGHVRQLQVEDERSPLLFFRGGYGEFAPIGPENPSLPRSGDGAKIRTGATWDAPVEAKV